DITEIDPTVGAKVRMPAVDGGAARTLQRQPGAADVTETSARRILVSAGRRCFVLHDATPPLARLHQKTRPPVLAPASFRLLGTLRPLLPIAQDGDASRIDPVGDEVAPHGLRPTLAEIDVDFVLPMRVSAVVTVAFDEYEIGRMGSQPCRIRFEDVHVVRPNVGLAEIEIDVAQLGDRFVVFGPRQTDRAIWHACGCSRS